ncbi:MAG: hypothetical protein ACM3QS_12150 [Bacteroidota bacterium]
MKISHAARARVTAGFLAAVLVTLACGATSPPTPSVDLASTKAALTFEAATTATPPVLPPALTLVPPAATLPAAIPLSFSGITLVIPNGLATGAQSETVPQSSGTDLPAWDIHPSYTHITLQDYPLQGTLLQPEIFIYPADEFGQLSAGAGQTINDLKDIVYSPELLPQDHLPFLPPLNATQVFYSNFQRLSFATGAGIRYLTQYDQAPLPINNHELIYTFQGLTQDGKTYVAAVLPVNAAFLSAQSDPASPLPPDGVPFDWNHFEGMPAYLEAVKQKLETSDPNAFTPTLPMLDDLIQSLRIVPP